MKAALGLGEGERLWAMHLDAFRALCAAAGQWRCRLVFTEHGPREIVTGLDLAAARVAWDVLQIPLSPASWSDLTVMVGEAVRALNGEPA